MSITRELLTTRFGRRVLAVGLVAGASVVGVSMASAAAAEDKAPAPTTSTTTKKRTNGTKDFLIVKMDEVLLT